MSSTSKSRINFNLKPKYSNVQTKADEFQKKVNRGTSADGNQRKNQVEQKTNTPKRANKQHVDFSPIRQKTQQDQVQQKQKESVSPQGILKIAEKQRSISIALDIKESKQINQSQHYTIKEHVQPKNTITNHLNTQRSSFKPSEITQKQKPIQVQTKQSQMNQIQQQKIEPKTNPLKNYNKKKELKIAIPITKREEVQDQKKQYEVPYQIQTARQAPEKKSLSPNSKSIKTYRGNSPSYHQNQQTQKLTVLLSSVIRPIFKDAKYYISSIIHFLRQQYFPNTTPYKLQFDIEFSEQQFYFRQKFCDHFFTTFSNFKQCQTLQQKTTFKPIYLDPPKQPKLNKGSIKTIIFDLDETLIHCNDINLNPTDQEVMVQISNESAQKVRFNIRPHCIEMLQTLSQFYELILFTASYKEYADKILEFIDPKNSFFSYRLYRDNCVTLGEGLLVKDLSVIGGRKIDSMVLVDNSAYCYFFQPDNGIPIIPFEENKKDKELIFLTDYLIKCEKFPNWLEHHKHHFRNFIYFQSASYNECIRRII